MKHQHKLPLLLNIMGLARATFYYKPKMKNYSSIRARILQLHQENQGRDGYRTLRAKLREEGIFISGKTVLSHMRALSIREIIAYEIGRRANFPLVAGMLKKTLAQLGEDDLPIIHSDRGCLYGLARWREMLMRADGTPYAIQSMSRRGNCYDNAVIESFFSLLKSECFYSRQFANIDELEQALHKHIRYYNEKRIKPGLKNLSPVQYRAQYLS